MIGSLLDTILDRTVVAGYTNVGYRIRSRGWDASDLRPMLGKVVLVTGEGNDEEVVLLGEIAGGGFEEQKAERLAASLAPTVAHRTVT